MKLELDVLNIKQVRFGPKTVVGGGLLSVNREELEELILGDKRLSAVEIELANPGEKCRIACVVDVIEPRAKAKGGEDFPGAVGAQGSAGTGTTCVLRGVAVAVSEYWAQAGSRDPLGDFIDMWRPGAEAGPYGKTVNVSILPHP